MSKDTATMHSPCAISHKFTKTVIHFLQLGRSSLLQGVVTLCPSLRLHAEHTIMRSTPPWYRVSLTVGGWESTLPMTCDRCEDSVLQVRVTADFYCCHEGPVQCCHLHWTQGTPKLLPGLQKRLLLLLQALDVYTVQIIRTFPTDCEPKLLHNTIAKN